MAGTANTAPTRVAGNLWLDGILWGQQWDSAGSPVVSVYIAGRAANETVSLVGQRITALSSIGADEIRAFESAMDSMAAVCGISFVAASSQSDADLIWACISNAEGEGALGWANPPGSGYSTVFGDHQSVVAINQSGYLGTSLAVGSYDYVTIIHELGHAVGLAHPHDRGGRSTVFPGVSAEFGDYGAHDMNQGVFTMMSYNDGWQAAPHRKSGAGSFGWEGTPMALDVAALQFMYGANASTAAGSDTYTLPGANRPGTYYSCIWDTGGNDTIVGASGRANLIDLRAATLLAEAGGGGFLSYASGIHGGFTIANGVVVENATGAELADAIIGNGAANVLYGRGGADILDGGEGADTLRGGAGADTVTGGGGDDLVVGGRGDDRLWGNGDDDTLYGRSGDDGLYGSTGDDFIGGGRGDDLARGGIGNDTLDGRDGADTLLGGAGNDSVGGGDGTDILRGSDGDDILDGGSGSDEVLGGRGNDLIFGGAGSGADMLSGGNGNDTLHGGRGSDRLDGGIGDDLLAGGRGSDLFVFAGAFGHDTIAGFDHASGLRHGDPDLIDFTDLHAIAGDALRIDDLVLTRLRVGVVIALDLDGNGVADTRDLDGDGEADSASILVLEASVGDFSADDFAF